MSRREESHFERCLRFPIVIAFDSHARDSDNKETSRRSSMCRVLGRVSLCSLVLFVLGAAHAVQWDFEDGTLQGWKVTAGDAGPLPVNSADDRHGGDFAKQGQYFIGTYENLKDEAHVEIQSPVFAVSSKRMSLLVGGGADKNLTYIAMYRVSDGTELFRAAGNDSETMQRRYWDTSPYIGQEVYLKIVDHSSTSWGHINVDDIRELNNEEIARLEKEEREREAAREKWMSNLMSPVGRRVYKGRAITDVAMPLGGMGAGNIAICGDGALREWQIFNKINPGCVVPGHFFAIWTKIGNKPPVSRLLRSTSVDGLPEVAETEFVGEFPIAEVHYNDAKLPVDVVLEAFSPFIPMNSKDSGIPGIFFVFKVRNTQKEEVLVSLAASLQNAVNYDGRTEIKGVGYEGYGGNQNRFVREGTLSMIHMSNPQLDSSERQYGTMTLGVLEQCASALPQWDATGALWEDFAADGKFEPQVDRGQSERGRTWNGALAVPFTLKPGESKRIVFLITWNFPNHYVEYDKSHENDFLGRMYSNWFKDSADVARYMAENYLRLYKDTHRFRDAFYDSSLPYWFLDRISANISTLTSQVCMWIADGSFHGFEGAGCCPMNCTHVWNYEQTLAHLFPDIERKMRHTDLVIQMQPSGGVRHRTVLPLTAPRGTEPFVDGQLGTILKAYREHLLSADRKWLDEMWLRIKTAMDFVIREWDPNVDGVLVNEQWNTYDAAMYGPNTFIGTLYLAALRAAEEMARFEGDAESAGRYCFIFEKGREQLDSLLWNGYYWIHIESKEKAPDQSASWIADWPKENRDVNRPYGTGCHSDQLLGQWWAHILNLGYVLPQERVQTALDSIMKYNWRWDFGDVTQQRAFAGSGDKGLLNCTWPFGGRPDTAILYADEVWTGIEYEVAGLLIAENKIREAFQIVRAVSERYDGLPRAPIKRNPWSEIECGDHYARAMSSWAMLLLAQGFSYNGPDGVIGFAPRIRPENHRSFFTTAEGWGTFSQYRTSSSQVNTLSLRYGRLSVKLLNIALPHGVEPKSVIIGIGRRSVPFEKLVEKDVLTLCFSTPLVLEAGDQLKVEVEW